MKKKIKSLIIILLILSFISGGVFLLKYLFLNQIKARMGQTLKYSSIALTIFPPKLKIIAPTFQKNNIFFSAEELVISFPVRSILREKQFEVFIEKPLIKIFPAPVSGKGADFLLPLIIKKGVIHKGKIQYKNNGLTINSLETNIFFTQMEKGIFIVYKADNYHFSFPRKKIDLEGKINITAHIRGKKIKVRKLKYYGKDFWFNINGEIEDISRPVFNFKTFYNINASKIEKIFSLPFKLQGRIEGKGTFNKEKYITYKGEIYSNQLIFENSEVSPAFGTINFSNLKGVNLNLWLNNKKSPLFLKILPDYIKGEFKNFNLKPILNWLSLGWPIKSPSWGNFEIKNKRLKAYFKFLDDYSLSENGFPLKGELELEWNGKKLVRLNSSLLKSSFGDFKLSGIVLINDKMDIKVDAEVRNFRDTVNFVNSLLKLSLKTPPIKGKGSISVKAFGLYSKPEIFFSFNFYNSGIFGFNFLKIAGEMVYKNELFGEIKIKDNYFNGIGTLNVNENKTFLNINLEEGDINRIFSNLNLKIPVKGKVSGKIFISVINEQFSCETVFNSRRLEAINKIFENVNGVFRWSKKEIAFPSIKLDLNGGSILGELYFNPITKELNLNVKGKGMDISSFYSSLKGILSFSIKGNSKFEKGMISGDFEIDNFSYLSYPKRKITGKISLGEIEENISLELLGTIKPGKNEFVAQLIHPLNKNEIKGKFDLKIGDLDLIIPWKGAKGKLNLRFEISGSLNEPEIKAIADFEGEELPIPKFAHSLKDFAGLVLLEKDKLQILSIKGKLGGGEVNGFGEMKLKGLKGVDKLDFKLQGKNMHISPFEKTRFLCDSKLNLIKDNENFMLSGEIFVHQMLWTRDIGEKIVFSSSPFIKEESKNELLKGLLLDLIIHSEGGCWINNSLGTVECKFNLRIFGNISSLRILGEIVALRGKLFFQDRTFNLIEGKIDFTDPLNPNNPEINFRAETFIKDYRVIFSLTGPLNHLNPELSSSPPLPTEEILALLALGEAFERIYSYDKSTQLSLSSFLSFRLTERLTSRASKILGLDWLRISPLLTGSTFLATPRLSLGKKITEDITVLYSTNLSTNRRDYLFLEWKFTRDMSIIAIRDEEGRIGLDVKVQKRF